MFVLTFGNSVLAASNLTNLIFWIESLSNTTIHYLHWKHKIVLTISRQLSRLCLTFLVWCFGSLSLFQFKLLFVRKFLSMKTCVMYKPAKWFSLQCNCLVSIWCGTLLRGNFRTFCGFLNITLFAHLCFRLIELMSMVFFFT